MSSLSPLEALELVVEKAGSQSELARRLGISQPSVWKWVQSSKKMPPEYVLTAEALFGVSRHDLRPDIYPRNHPPAPDARMQMVDRGSAQQGREQFA